MAYVRKSYLALPPVLVCFVLFAQTGSCHSRARRKLHRRQHGERASSPFKSHQRSVKKLREQLEASYRCTAPCSISTEEQPDTVAELTAGAGNNSSVGLRSRAQASTSNTQINMIITYADATTTSDISNASSAQVQSANAGGITRTTGNLVAGLDKDVTAIRIETAGTRTGTRSGVISAREVAQ